METKPLSDNVNSRLRLFDIYSRTKYLSVKHDSYFQVYEELLAKYVGRSITFVEVGIFNGGSLFMWREFFGPEARIIGIDCNPSSLQWRNDGFEIFLGDQGDPVFWKDFFQQVGPIDILLDDGGHTNSQQIVTTNESLEYINDGGLLIIEDVHTSYMYDFGNPYRYSFINFIKNVPDIINSRSSLVSLRESIFAKKVYSIGFYESIVALHIDGARCFKSAPTSNGGLPDETAVVAHEKIRAVSWRRWISIYFPWTDRVGWLRSMKDKAFAWRHALRERARSRALKHLFR